MVKYDLSRLIKWCVGVTIGFILMEVVYGIQAGFLYQFYTQVENGSLTVVEQDARSQMLDDAGVFIAVLYTGVMLATFILNGMWLYRASSNAGEIDPNPKRISPSMAVAWYVIPIANLFMPFRSMKQTYNSSRQPAVDMDEKLPSYFGWWWAAWLISTTLANISTQIYMRDESLEAGITSTIIDMVATPISIAAAFLFIKIMKSVTELQADAAAGANRMAEVFS